MIDEQDVRRIAGNQTPGAHESQHATGGSDAFLSTDVLEAACKRIKPTGSILTWGALTDTQYVKVSGSGLISGALPVFGTLNEGEYLIYSSSTVVTAAITSPFLDLVTADTTVTAASDASLYSYSIAGGVLSTANAVELVAMGTWGCRNGSGTVDSLTLRIKYDTTTLLTVVIPDRDNDVAASNLAWRINVLFAADGATNAQVANLVGFGFLGVDYSQVVSIGGGTSAVDSTAAKTLALTAAWGSANAANTITLQYACLMKYSL